MADGGEHALWDTLFQSVSPEEEMEAAGSSPCSCPPLLASFPPPLHAQESTEIAADQGALPAPVSQELLGPSTWVTRLQQAFGPIYGNLGPQRRPLHFVTACSGTGCPTLAMQVEVAQANLWSPITNTVESSLSPITDTAPPENVSRGLFENVGWTTTGDSCLLSFRLESGGSGIGPLPGVVLMRPQAASDGLLPNQRKGRAPLQVLKRLD